MGNQFDFLFGLPFFGFTFFWPSSLSASINAVVLICVVYFSSIENNSFTLLNATVFFIRYVRGCAPVLTFYFVHFYYFTAVSSIPFRLSYMWSVFVRRGGGGSDVTHHEMQ